jgi:uncharacterized protein (TIGR00645 family)
MNKPNNTIESWLERLLFAGRWIMTPVCVGLLVVLAAVAVKFVEEVVITIELVLSMQERDLVLFVLSLIDLALLGSLILMVSLAGYENFVRCTRLVAMRIGRIGWAM